MKRTLTTCPYCGTGCNLYLVSDDEGRLVGVEPSTESPVSPGQLCVKGWNAFEFVQHPDRITRPLIRKGGQLRPSSWDEALDLVVKRLKEIQAKHGPDSIAFFSSAKATNEENYLMMKLARAVFKTNNIDHCARLCHSSTVVGLATTFGSGAMTNSYSCLDQADCILVAGSNTTEQHPLIGTRIINAVRRGAKLIVVDSRRTRLARHAHLHLRPRNGTDVALINSLMQVIIERGWQDQRFIAERTENYDELVKVVKGYPPEKVAPVAGISPQEIIEAARLFATSPRGMILYSMGITQHTHGVDNVKCLANLAMLTGNLGRPGTGVNPLRGQNNVQGACDMGALPDVYSGYQKVTDPAIRKKFERAWGVEDLPQRPGLTSTQALDAVSKGGIKALYVLGENVMMSHPDLDHVRMALQGLEFLVVQEIFPTPTTDLAQVVLPAASYAEKEGTFTSSERRVQRVRKAIEPIGESRPDWQIIGEIGKRAGYPGLTYSTPELIMEEIASLTPIYGGISYARLEKESLQWPCPDFTHPGTSILHQERFTRGRGLFAPVEYRPSVELPDRNYPFLLSTGRCYFHFHGASMTRRSRLLSREVPFPYVEMNPADARQLGIGEREWIFVATRRGQIRAQARLTEDVAPGTLFLPFHFHESAANQLTLNALDPEAKIPEFKVCAAAIRRSQ